MRDRPLVRAADVTDFDQAFTCYSFLDFFCYAFREVPISEPQIRSHLSSSGPLLLLVGFELENFVP